MILAALLAAALAQEAVPWSEVRPKRRVEPRFPEAAKALNIEEDTCIVRFFIDEAGKPYDVTVEGCSTVFHDAVKEAAWKWTFHPVLGPEGQPVKATFTLKIHFILNDSPGSGGPDGSDPFVVTLGGAWSPPVGAAGPSALGRGITAGLRGEDHEFVLDFSLGYAVDLPADPGVEIAYFKVMFGPSLPLVTREGLLLGADALVGLGPGVSWEPESGDKDYGPGFSWQVGLPLTVLGGDGTGVSLRPAIGGSRHLDYGAFSGTDTPFRSFFRSGVRIPLQAHIGLYRAWND